MQEVPEIWVLTTSEEDPLQEECNPLQHSCLKNPMDRGAWWTRVAQSQTQLKDWVCMQGFILKTCLLCSNCCFTCYNFSFHFLYPKDKAIYTLTLFKTLWKWGRLKTVNMHFRHTFFKYIQVYIINLGNLNTTYWVPHWK